MTHETLHQSTGSVPIRAACVFSQAMCQAGHGAAHPLKPERLQRTCDLLMAYRAFDAEGSQLVPARPATVEELTLFHTEEYVSAVERLSRGDRGVSAARYNFGPGDNPVWPGMFETTALKVGGSLVAADLLLTGQADVAFSFAGGLHHAGPNFASGFCVFNDPAVVIHHLLRHGLRVAYVDIDAHHADGVQNAFYDTDQVLTISLHESGRYLFPGTGFVEEIGRGKGRGFSINVPLFPYTDDDTYLWAFEQVVPPQIARFQPDIVVSQLGTDTHWRDPLTHLSLTTAGYVAVVERIRDLAPRWLALGGGGYDVTVVPHTWTLAYGVMSGQDFPDELPSAYAQQYEAGWLRDRHAPHIDPGTRAQARRYAEERVARLKDILASVSSGR